MTFYAILGVARDADDQMIRTAYRALARRYHPDFGEGSSPDRFRGVVDAYQTLSDPDRRRAYDLELRHRQARSEPVRPVTPVEPLRPTRPTYCPGWYLDTLFEEILDFLEDDGHSLGSRYRWP